MFFPKNHVLSLPSEGTFVMVCEDLTNQNLLSGGLYGSCYHNVKRLELSCPANLPSQS